MEERRGGLMDEIDAKTRLAGSNKLEILLFSLGGDEVFAINVFKVKEVTPCPKITRMPHMRSGVVGVFSLRGNVLPALDLGTFAGMGDIGVGSNRVMIVTEYNQSAQGFIVHSIDRIIRVDWDQVRAPKSIIASGHSMITALTELPDGKLVSILDVEQVLFDAFGDAKMPSLHSVSKPEKELVGQGFYVDDSGIARKKIQEVFDHLGVKAQFAENGREAWDRLRQLAQAAVLSGALLSDQLKVILTDAEMPEMDGYVLTRLIKNDARFDGIPVVMHSSLSSQANRAMGEAVGVDGYVAKFDPQNLVETLLSRWPQ
jgi:two-component system chemotaxis response regulator CheV